MERNVGLTLTVPRLSRRDCLISVAALSLAGLAPTRHARAVDRMRLVAEAGEAPLVANEGPATPVWSYNGQVPGPVLRARQGERLRVEVENRLDEPTTVHWHGLRIPVEMDGVPWVSQPPIAPGETFVYEFDLTDAGTFWYHPHINSAQQVGRGLHGALIVEERNPPEVDREILWVMDDWRLDRSAQVMPFGGMMDLSHAGRLGNTVTVNGSIAMAEALRSGERVRLRLINVANARTFAVQLPEMPVWLVALDGHPVPPHPLAGNRVVLGVGMRADLILDMTGAPGDRVPVIDDAYGRERAYELMTFVYEDRPALKKATRPAPAALEPNPVTLPEPDGAERHRVVFEGGAMGRMHGAMMGGRFMSMRDLAGAGRLWAMNGVVPENVFEAEPLLTLSLGRSHIIELVNQTAFDHPIHLHGHSFRILRQGGQPVPHQPLRDTVLLAPQQTAEIALFADNPGMWMFHCHILEHQGSGMMAKVKVA